MKIALIHDALCTAGGAERLAYQMFEALPEADFFTSVYLPEKTYPEFSATQVKTLPASRLVKTERQFKLSFPYWLYALGRLNLDNYDRILTSSTYLAKFINRKYAGKHHSYINAPFRLLWKPQSYTSESLPTPRILSPAVGLMAKSLRKWDRQRTREIKAIAANSYNMAAEIQRVYGREARVIYPPVDTDKFTLSSEHSGGYLTVSRLISHKRIDLAIAACNTLERRLTVVGDGPARSALEASAGPTIRFAGRVSEAELVRLYQSATALIFPGEEDFGIVPLEAQSCGTPVIAFGKGGLLETVKENFSGIFFHQQTLDSLTRAIRQFEALQFDPAAIRTAIMDFNLASFSENIRRFALD